MKIAKGFVLRKIVDQNIVVPIGEAVVNRNTMISLNGCGAFLWQQLQTEKTGKELLISLLEEYDIDEEKARKDLYGFLKRLMEKGLLENVNENP